MNTLLWYAWISKLLNSGTSICLTSMPCACPGARQAILILCQSCKPKFSLEAIIDWFVRPINLWPFGCKYSFRNIILQLHWQAWNVLLTFVCVKLSEFLAFLSPCCFAVEPGYHQRAECGASRRNQQICVTVTLCCVLPVLLNVIAAFQKLTSLGYSMYSPVAAFGFAQTSITNKALNRLFPNKAFAKGTSLHVY